MGCIIILLFYILYLSDKLRQEWTRLPIMVTHSCFYLVANLFFSYVYVYTYPHVGIGSFINSIETERYVRNVWTLEKPF